MAVLCPAMSQGAEPESVSIQLKWHHSFQFAGYYAAIEKGFYAEEGLDVRLVERKISGKHYIQSVIEGDCQYGTADTGLLLRHAQGAPVVWLTQIFQHSPLILLTLSTSNIFSPYELAGKTVAYDLANAGNASIQMLLNRTIGTQKQQFSAVQINYDLNRLINGKIDATAAYLSDQPFALKQLGHDVNIIDPRSYGIDFYGDNLFTSHDELIKHPQRVDKMIRATLKGWNYALDHPQEIIDLILTKYNTRHMTQEHLRYEAKITDRMIMRELVPLGSMDPRRIESILHAHVQLGFLMDSHMPQGLFYGLSSAKITLTSEEQQWLLQHPHISFVMGESMEPIVIKQPDGSIVGIIPDFLNYLGDMIGQKLYLTTQTDLKHPHQGVQHKDQFGIAVTLDSPERRHAFLFTDAYYQTPLVVFTHKNKTDQISGRDDLQGKTVAIVQGHPATEHYLKQVADVSIVYSDSAEDQLKLLQYGKVDAIVGYTNYHYLIEKYLYTNLIPAFSTERQFPIYMGVNPQYAPLVGILNKAIASLGEQTRSHIISHWLNQHNYPQQSQENLPLSADEKHYLSGLKSIRVCAQADAMPYELVDDTGNYYGIIADYMDLFSSQLQRPIEVVATKNDLDSLSALNQKRCDIVAAHSLEETEQAHPLGTHPYLDSPRVFAVHSSSPPANDFNALASGRIGVVAYSAEASFLTDIYPQANLIPVASIRQGLQLVANRELDAFVGVLGSISYAIQKLALSSVKIGGAIPSNDRLVILVSEEQAPLLPILNKAIDRLTPQDRKQIINRWISVTYDNGLDYRTLTKAGGAVLLIVGFLLYRQYLIRRSNLILMAAHRELEEKNQELNRLSMTDKLTGLLNRHAIEPIIDNAIGRHKRSNTPVSLLIVDLDYFKRINDNFGHAAGDKVLREVSTALVAATRSSDSLARWGGEEFLLVAGDTQILKATALAEKIRQTIAGLQIDDIPVTASIGVAEFNSDETFHQWYERCDKALYQAKDSGRNCVKVSQMSRSEISAPVSINNVLQLSWSHKFCCGHDTIDEQHMGLFALGNELIEAFLMRQDKRLVDDKLEELYKNTCDHFSFEEQLLEEVHYPNLTEHRHEHRHMEKKLMRLIDQYQQNRADYSELLHYISIDLISGHLLCTDNDYFPYLINDSVRVTRSRALDPL
ncbi:ABC transporter substrate-binding protein [uncultured Desulfuromonas sp.]|uniref:ABC transporter substrate-binding protein n=1 Tax=uncultured Desulfuromonas sp. TaxID=181013 RepID=UPI002AAB3045|nr:transporter substrate-binding domain-containing protein [uncultured Desulfuromonas sp.]